MIKQETDLTVELMAGVDWSRIGMPNNCLTIEGENIIIKLQFKSDDLNQVMEGKKQTGKVIFASIATDAERVEDMEKPYAKIEVK